MLSPSQGTRQLSPPPSPNAPPGGRAGGPARKVQASSLASAHAEKVDRSPFVLLSALFTKCLRSRGQALGDLILPEGEFLHLPNSIRPGPSWGTLRPCGQQQQHRTHMLSRLTCWAVSPHGGDVAPHSLVAFLWSPWGMSLFARLCHSDFSFRERPGHILCPLLLLFLIRFPFFFGLIFQKFLDCSSYSLLLV